MQTNSTTRHYEYGKLAAYARGVTYGHDEIREFAELAANGREYVIAFDGEEIGSHPLTAIDDDVATRFAARLYTSGYTLLRRETRYTEIVTVPA